MARAIVGDHLTVTPSTLEVCQSVSGPGGRLASGFRTPSKSRKALALISIRSRDAIVGARQLDSHPVCGAVAVHARDRRRPDGSPRVGHLCRLERATARIELGCWLVAIGLSRWVPKICRGFPDATTIPLGRICHEASALPSRRSRDSCCDGGSRHRVKAWVHPRFLTRWHLTTVIATRLTCLYQTTHTQLISNQGGKSCPGTPSIMHNPTLRGDKRLPRPGCSLDQRAWHHRTVALG